ncbi:MAG: hypothetical protein ACXVJP_07345 [Mucilaginibacter sp.]
MKTQIVRLIALLIFASIAMTGCSVEYREGHRHHNEGGDRDNHDRDNHDNDHHDRDNH